MTSSTPRLREHPEVRFEPSQHPIDLGQATAKLLAEPVSDHPHRRHETLYKNGPLTVALFIFESGQQLPQHSTDGVVTIQALEGELKIAAEGQIHNLTAGQMLILAPGVTHDVDALTHSRMLLTVCLAQSKGD